jgi:molybdopterin-guanine dinucleotide biosynthesis protein A
MPDKSEIPVVILAGGMGTRFREETELQDWRELDRLWASGDAPWKVWPE